MTTITETIAAIRAALQESRDACAPPSLDGVYLLRDSAAALCDEVERLQNELDTWRSVFPDIAPENVMPDRSVLEAEIKRLTAENARLRAQLEKQNEKD